ncbi:formate dehydrogenase subunit delta [Mycolicibacterium chlorophenolicum]|uniref:NADH-dependent formate dehydrogenase delta subunit FdsD n=1 Tax=Mycolicibacterium chlorophenolicum TaxID=37916 RepID=A0A0J6V805_9MYCO|nr:formate dehydrogenase subunit delta [Mycolicibacterium chlorophenolicum]KMO66980.1 NADH-dependent formate dehydrogenase delta subunit FdsD [Mycolicibacterium chlorophenolicum]
MAAPAEIRLANEIAAQFRNLPLEHGAAAIATHILNFWDPRMRARLINQVTQAGDNCDALIAAAANLVEHGRPLKPWGG